MGETLVFFDLGFLNAEGFLRTREGFSLAAAGNITVTEVGATFGFGKAFK